MKHKFINIALFAGSFFLIQTATAQFDTDLFSQQKLLQKPAVEHSNTTPGLVWKHQLDSTFVPQDMHKNQHSRLLTPNIAWQVKNKNQNNSSALVLHNTFASKKTSPDLLYQKKPAGSVSFPAQTNEMTAQLNEGSIDPGIFYAPEEKSIPAAVIIKPLKNLDPEMVIDPDKLH